MSSSSTHPIGILTGLPSMLFAHCSGARRAVDRAAGRAHGFGDRLAVTAIGRCAARSDPRCGMALCDDIAMGAGVAVMQVTMPPAVRAWFPQRIALPRRLYNGLLIGEILPVALMLPLVLPLVGNVAAGFSWSGSVPVVSSAILVMALAPRQVSANGSASPRRRWWPD